MNKTWIVLGVSVILVAIIFGSKLFSEKPVEKEPEEQKTVDLYDSYIQNSYDAPTREEVLQALDQWAKGIIAISSAYENKGDYKAVATEFIKKTYNYDNGLVLFKPTMAIKTPFRTTFEGALSYFTDINTHPDFEEDIGFALNNWVSINYDIIGIIYDTNRALVQTKVTFTKADDTRIKTYFSMSFTRKTRNDDLKIDLHHSSIPHTKKH